MLVVLSPAKALDFSPLPSALASLPFTVPALAAETNALKPVVQALTAADLRRLMDISDALADLNHARFQAFAGPLAAVTPQPELCKQAALAFDGDTYSGLDAASLTVADWDWGQEHVRILSGLYGLLRPLDLIEPYRLEMGTKLPTARGKDLYAFWKGHIAPLLRSAVEASGTSLLVNCASTEYFKAAEEKALGLRVVTPVFHECKGGGKGKVVGLMAKRARGMMARFIVQNRLAHPDDLKDFSAAGYAYDAEASSGDHWVFSRVV